MLDQRLDYDARLQATRQWTTYVVLLNTLDLIKLIEDVDAPSIMLKFARKSDYASDR